MIKEMPDRIGNLSFSEAAEKAARLGYSRPVKAVYSWSDARRGGKEVWRSEDCPPELEGKLMLSSTKVEGVRNISVGVLVPDEYPEQEWKTVFVPFDGVIAVTRSEDYNTGQSSTWYFAR